MTATSPTQLLVPAAPPVAPERTATPAAGKKPDSFAQQLARQRDAAANDTRPPGGPAGKPGKPAHGKPASDPAAGQQDPAADAQPATAAADPAAAAAAGAATVQAQAQPPSPPAATPPALPAQALEIATQAAQLQQQAAPARQTVAQAAAPMLAPAPAPQGKAAAPSPTAAPPVVANTTPAAAPPALPSTAPVSAQAAAPAGPPTRHAAVQDMRAAAAPTPHAATTLEGLGLADGDAEAALREATHLAALATATPASHPAGNDAPVAAPGLAAASLMAARPDTNASSLLPPGAGPLTLGIGTPVAATPAWGADLGRQLVVLSHDATQGRQTAELRLDPPDLGPLRVTLSVNDGVASASFVSAHAAVRHAVEAALPQLQQALAQAGLSLGQTSVGEQGAQSGFDMQQQSQGRGQGGGGSAADSGAVAAQSPAAPARRGDGLVDTFA